MKQIIPSLWFDDQAEDAANFYTTVFQDSKILGTDYYTDASKEIHGHNAGDVLTVEFELYGQRFVGLNGGPFFTFSPVISFLVRCRSVEEVDSIWKKISQDATVLMPLDTYSFSKRYGWLNDRFGVSWQIALSEDEVTQRILPSLMFVNEKCGKAEEAMNFYTSIFRESSIGTIGRYGANQQPDKEGTIAYGEFSLEGNQFVAMDSARMHDFDFSESISLMVECDTQEEIDYYWGALSAAPEAEQCGWLKDKYGVSWQIVPKILYEMLQGGTQEQRERVTGAFLEMKKFNISELERVYYSV